MSEHEHATFMKLGKDTGSMINHVASLHDDYGPPHVGMGVTQLMWTDRRPYTVMRVNEIGTKAWIQEDEAIRTDDRGMSDAQSYRYEPDPEAPLVMITRRKDGHWYRKGEPMGSNRFLIGVRSAYHDYSF